VAATYDSISTVFSTWQPETELSRLNRAPADSAFTLSPWLRECLGEAVHLNRISSGAFDPTAEPLMRLWGFYRREGRLPGEAEVDSARALMGGFQLTGEGQVVKQTPNTRFDLGGIAKGFAVDQVMARLEARGMTDGLVDLGGNLFCLGGAEGRDHWRVGVRDPLDRDRYFATLAVSGRALATSGSYERFVTIDGRRYGHIMNPATGRPAEGVLGVTVLAPTAQLADGLSTALFISGPEVGNHILDQLSEQVDVIMVLPGSGPGNATVLYSPGLAGKINLLKEYEGRFTLRAW
jgi:thiamine biosynthesis lipoprotein